MHIGILSYNKPQLTRECLDTTLKFVPPEHITLAHNGSKPEVIENLQTLYPKVIHHITPVNRGYTGGSNDLLTECFKKSEWTLFITNDCLLQNQPQTPQKPGLYAPTILRRQSPNIDSIGGLFQPVTGKLQHLRCPQKAETASAERQTLKHRLLPVRPYFYVPGTAFYIHKSVFTHLGGFDESLHTYWEDVDFSARAYKARLHLGLMPDTVFRHKIGKTCHKDPFYTKTLFQRNRRIVSKRHSILHLPPLPQNWHFLSK